MTRSRKNNRQSKTSGRGMFSGLENLESRQMFSATGFSFYTVPLASGTELVCQMTAPSQQMSVVRSADGIQFNLNGQVEDIAGNFAYLSIIAQSGNNSIVVGPNMLTPTCVWGGSGNDVISTGASNDDLRATGGDDTLVATGGYDNQLFAGWGYTNIWAAEDCGNTYYQGTGQLATHFFNSFINTGDTVLDGMPNAQEPGTNTQMQVLNPNWANVMTYNLPLFGANGPLMTDINQRECGDCYFLSTLAAVAGADSQAIRNMITPLGDGTYAVQFYNSEGIAQFVRVDGTLPTEDGNLVYAQLGSDGSTWVALMEKAWAYFAPSQNGELADYGNIEGGDADPVYQALGGSNIQGTFVNGQEWGQSAFGNSTYFAEWINWKLNQGDAMSIAFSDGNSNDDFSIPNILENDHEYTLVSDTINNYGQVTGFWVRNPWGFDVSENGSEALAASGHNNGQDLGMVWVSVNQAWSVFADIGAAQV